MQQVAKGVYNFVVVLSCTQIKCKSILARVPRSVLFAFTYNFKIPAIFLYKQYIGSTVSCTIY